MTAINILYLAIFCIIVAIPCAWLALDIRDGRRDFNR